MVDIDVGLVPGYVIVEEIGRGGFGVVYRAQQESLNRDVAVKLLPAAGMGERTRKRFDRECQAMALLAEHPNIVSIFDHGITTDSRRPYIVMEFVAGGSVSTRTPLPWVRAIEIGVQLAGALETAHRAGILHRDVKPENILLSVYGDAKLADFGVAKVQDSSETPTGNITASILHASPESLVGNRPSARSDVYSLASTLYAVIMGRAPFSRDDDESLAPLITRICLEPAPDLRVEGVPSSVAEVLRKGMAKEPADRYASAGEFGEALAHAQADCGAAVTPMRVFGDAVADFEADLDADRTMSRTPRSVAAALPGGDLTLPRQRAALDSAGRPVGRRGLRGHPYALLVGLIAALVAVTGGALSFTQAGRDTVSPLPSVTTKASSTAPIAGRSKAASAAPAVGAVAGPGGAVVAAPGAGGVASGAGPVAAGGAPVAAGGGGSSGSAPGQVGALLAPGGGTLPKPGVPVTPPKVSVPVAPAPAPPQLPTVPNVYQLHTWDASAALRSRGYVVGFSIAYNGAYSFPAQSVWSQYPGPGTSLARGSTVTIVQWDAGACPSYPANGTTSWCGIAPPRSPVMNGYFG